MNETSSCFSSSYAEARAKFLAAATDAGLVSQALVHPLRGPAGEELALDVVRDGPPDAKRVLLLSSACHGVEGFCGSGAQVALLRDPQWRQACVRAGVAVVYAHALNPWGFAWLRRMTHENVDLNRNVHDYGRPLPRNEGYEELADHIVPRQWPETPENRAVLDAFAQKHGAMALQRAITGGQHSHPEGLFFGGSSPTWSQGALRTVLRGQASQCGELGWVDFHTGLGPRGHGELILAGQPESLQRARALWGDVTSYFDGSSSSAPLTGNIYLAAYEEAPRAAYTGVALEYGVVPLQQTIDALRADQWLHAHPDATADQRASIMRDLVNAFYGNDDAWKADVVRQARQAALAFLGQPGRAVAGRFN